MPLEDLDPVILNYVNNELQKSNSWFEYHKDNILKRTDLDIIIHQANCFNIMNAGVAYALSSSYPEVLIEDKAFLKPGDKNKLGQFKAACVKNKNIDKDLIIINLYSQYKPGSSKCLPNSDIDSKLNRFKYLSEALNHLKEFIQLYNLELSIKNGDQQTVQKQKIRIGVPWMIGCGIAGGDINATFKLFEDIFNPINELVKIIFIDIN